MLVILRFKPGDTFEDFVQLSHHLNSKKLEFIQL